ncbi:MAG TPA: bacteriochlorophyll 4-vinyl reductase [Acetobacteraceae bacterium]|jgi:divinyl protochlorophyllide a 8-vinyl-reductase|nr:bacteriochlorophyll 4-vinyl reductase [Acetobacteraceae bacterium]
MDGAIAAARIGPNAVTRLAEAAREVLPGEEVLALFEEAGLAHRLANPPHRMVEEREVTRLHAVLRRRVGVPVARLLGAEAGRRTADYLLAHRIPRPLQGLLRLLPARLAARVLLGAVTRHAWTFAGSGRFSVDTGRPVRVVLEGCPLCRGAASGQPLCDFYAAAFSRLFRALVSRRTRVAQTGCAAMGDPACTFELRW